VPHHVLRPPTFRITRHGCRLTCPVTAAAAAVRHHELRRPLHLCRDGGGRHRATPSAVAAAILVAKGGGCRLVTPLARTAAALVPSWRQPPTCYITRGGGRRMCWYRGRLPPRRPMCGEGRRTCSLTATATAVPHLSKRLPPKLSSFGGGHRREPQ